MPSSVVVAETIYAPELQAARGAAARRASAPHCSVAVGGISLTLASSHRDLVRLSPELHPFCTHPAAREISVECQWEDDLTAPIRSRIFDSGALWSVSASQAELVFDFASPAFAANPYKILRVDADFRRAKLMLNRRAFGSLFALPLEYPADELLFTNYLAHHGLGVEVHGCGLVDAERGGFLFLGHSGAGKSTTARLWNSLRHPEILSDDRIILRLHDGELWMYGTPWHGEAAYASPGRARLKGIFILQHGSRNHMRPMGRAEAAGELFARTFPPFHSAVGLERTVEFLARVVAAAPCYEFQFVPDENAVDAALNFHV